MVVEGRKIVAIDPKATPVDYDLRGATLMPGWIDTHVHINWHFDANHKSVSGGDKPDEAALATADDAWATLMGGFTTVQSVGAAIDAAVRDHINRGLLPGPRILTSLRQINDKSGDPDALRALVRQTKADGADVIKLFATTGLGAGGNQSMTNEQIEATCSEAKAVGLRAVVHAIGDAGARAAVERRLHEHRARDVSHRRHARSDGWRAAPISIRISWCCTTTSTTASGFTFTPEALATLEKGIAPTLDVLRRARAKRVKIIFGTDAVAGAHGRNAEEFVYRVQDGAREADGRDRQRDVAVGRVARPRRAPSARSRRTTTPTWWRSPAIRSTTSPPSVVPSS